MRSVRARVTLLGVLLVVGVLAAAGFALRLTVERQLTTSGDDLALDRARELASVIASLPDPIGIGEDGVAQVVAADGSVLGASANITGRPAITTYRPPGDDPVVRTVEGPDDDESEAYRLWALNADGATVYVGRSLESVQEALATLTTALVLGLPILAVILAAALWLLVGRALSPVERLRTEVAGIAPSDLDHRVDVPATRDEVAALAATMNALLARLEDSAAREREFVGNASHELLGPVAAFRTQLEVALAHPDSAPWRDVARDLLDDTLGMEHLVKDLLFLARADAGELALRREPVDLAALVREHAGPHVTVEGDAPPLSGDVAALGRLVRNLLDNAKRHARRTVVVQLTPTGLVVSDDGPGVDPADRTRIFERFFQADPARSRVNGGGAGLGLAIARSIAERHGGSLAVAGTSRLGGADFELRLPPT